MSDDMVETTIPYDEVIAVLKKNKWDGYLLSEYEGPRDERAKTSDQLRKQHIMMKRLLGEV
jgi:sugar phosphate isomerase/epimerase